MVRRSVAAIVYPLLLAAVLVTQTSEQNPPEKGSVFAKTCAGLHADIRAQIMPPNTETPSVILTFLLLNDSETPLDVEAGSWRIVAMEAN